MLSGGEMQHWPVGLAGRFGRESGNVVPHPTLMMDKNLAVLKGGLWAGSSLRDLFWKPFLQRDGEGRGERRVGRCRWQLKMPPAKSRTKISKVTRRQDAIQPPAL